MKVPARIRHRYDEGGDGALFNKRKAMDLMDECFRHSVLPGLHLVSHALAAHAPSSIATAMLPVTSTARAHDTGAQFPAIGDGCGLDIMAYQR